MEVSFTYHTTHPSKLYNSWLLLYSQSCATIFTINFRPFSSKKEILDLLGPHPFNPPPALGKHQSTFCLYRFAFSGPFV